MDGERNDFWFELSRGSKAEGPRNRDSPVFSEGLEYNK